MKVILTADVKALGKKGEVVEVSDGYGRNAIIKKNLGVEATPKALNDLKLQNKHADKVAQENLEKARELAKEIEDKVMESIDKLNTRTLKPSKSKAADEADSDSDADNTSPEQSLEDERAAKRSSVAAKKANIDILVED